MSSSTESPTHDYAIISIDDCKESDEEELQSFRNAPPIPVYLDYTISRFKKDFGKGECIGQGGFGKVYLCFSWVDGQRYAIKEVKLKKNDNEKLEKQIMECRNHARFVHSNIVRYYDAWLESDSSSIFTTHVLYIKLELCDSTLENYIQKRMTGISKPICFNKKVMISLLRAVEYLHRKGVIHRDIKPNNIFIKSNDGEDTVLLGDFGRARSIQDKWSSDDTDSSLGLSSNVGTFLYSAPELSTNNYTEQVDIYSIGVVLYDFFNATYTKDERIVKLNELRDNGEPPDEFDLKFPTICFMIHVMISTKPDERPTATFLLSECKWCQERGKNLFSPNLME